MLDGSFNPPGGFGAFGTRLHTRHRLVHFGRFNPPGGFGAFGTSTILRFLRRSLSFQSAGRIWGFWNDIFIHVDAARSSGFNPPGGFGAFGTHAHVMPAKGRIERVSIRRADLGLLELGSSQEADSTLHRFQSAGRIWGFWNSIPMTRCVVGVYPFQSAGRIWGFWNHSRTSPR